MEKIAPALACLRRTGRWGVVASLPRHSRPKLFSCER
jgi:hypothetical protein